MCGYHDATVSVRHTIETHHPRLTSQIGSTVFHDVSLEGAAQAWSYGALRGQCPTVEVRTSDGCLDAPSPPGVGAAARGIRALIALIGVVAGSAAAAAGYVYMAALDPATNLLQLADLFDTGATVNRWARAWAAGEPLVIDDPARMLYLLDAAQAMVMARNVTALGFVDASVPRLGLARAWSSAGGRAVLTTGPHMHVDADPVDGLCVVTHGHEGRPLTGVTEVVVDSHTVHVIGQVRSLRVARSIAEPLVEVLPSSTHWRVRRVPEVLVWATTFSRLRDACAHAIDSGGTAILRLR